METGPIAPGMVRKIAVTIYCGEECTIKEVVQIVTKTDIYKVPVEATVLGPDTYQAQMNEAKALNGKTALSNSRVRTKLNQSIQRARGNEEGGEKEAEEQVQWGETTNSESKLPVIPQAEKRLFEVDPKKPLKDLLKRQ